MDYTWHQGHKAVYNTNIQFPNNNTQVSEEGHMICENVLDVKWKWGQGIGGYSRLLSLVG